MPRPRLATSFTVTDVAPTDPAWLSATESDRRAFWRAVVGLVLEIKGASLAKGLGTDGKRLKRVSDWTRKHRHSEMGEADPAAPALQPAYGLSRTRAWFTGRAYADRAQFYWRGGWGRILAFHAAGAKNRWAKSGRLPVRDVVGLSDRDLARVKRRAAAWWSRRVKAARDEALVREQLARDAGRGPRVVYLPPGVKPYRPSPKIQVYSDARPKAPPKPPPAPVPKPASKPPALPPRAVPVPKPVPKPVPVPVPRPSLVVPATTVKRSALGRFVAAVGSKARTLKQLVGGLFRRKGVV